jgi:hypothetical protein
VLFSTQVPTSSEKSTTGGGRISARCEDVAEDGLTSAATPQPERASTTMAAMGDGVFFFFLNRADEVEGLRGPFFNPNRAAMSAQQHPAVKNPQYVLQYRGHSVGASLTGPPLLKCYGGHSVELVAVWRRERGGLWPLVV